jgi:carbamoyltransferase
MNILGISCHYHDAAACLVRDGKIIAAASEERFNRIKYSAEFPINAINYCIQAGDITFSDLDYIGFYEKPYLKFSRVLLSHILSFPFSMRNFIETIPYWLQDRLIIPVLMRKELGFEDKVIFIKHHLSHAASAYLVSPFDEAAVLTADSVGEWATASIGYGRGNSIEIFDEIHYPDSLGLIYTAVTTYLGFRALSGEGKVMGLAGYGKPVYLDKFREIVTQKPDGSFSLDQSYFGLNTGNRMYNKKFIRAFGKERRPESEIDERHCDIAASLQKFTEDTVILLARRLYEKTKVDKLCLSGGLFLNCLVNSRILEETPFNEIFIQPAAGDAGGALGVAEYIYNTLLDNPRNFQMEDAYLGPSFSQKQIRRAILNNGLDYEELNDPELNKLAAQKISEDNIVGWFQGRMEYGPRALGNRSILANPCNPKMKDLLNSRVKHREYFRPFAPVVIEEMAEEYFKLNSHPSPFMLLAPHVNENKKDNIPSVTHVDGTARVQTVNKKSNSKLYNLIKEFEKITGVPVLINTSFNVRGEPIICEPQDAINCFLKTHMDYLVLGNYVIKKRERIQGV